MSNGGLSTDLDEILIWQRAAGKLREPAADVQRSEINSDEADLFDQRGHFRLCGAIVARIKQNPPAAVRPWIPRQHLCAEVIEGLDDACSRRETGNDLA